jgi:DNA gyrase subunit A
VLLSTTGLVAATSDDQPPVTLTGRQRDDVVTAAVTADRHGEVGLLTSRGRLVRLPVLTLPVLPPTAGTPSLTGGVPVGALVELAVGERVIALTTPGGHLAIGTRRGTVKRVATDPPSGRDSWEVITLPDGDEVVGAGTLPEGGPAELVFVTSDARLLRVRADSVREQGPRAAGVAGIRCAPDAHVVFFGVCPAPGGSPASREPVVVTIAGRSDALAGVDPGTAKVTPLAAFPVKGRGTAGVRAHRFLAGQDTLLAAWAGAGPARAADPDGMPVPLPDPDPRRDGSGVRLTTPVAGLGRPAQ